MTTRSLKILTLAAVILLAADAQAADTKYYRWTDSEGHVHYSDQATGNAKQVNPKVPGAGGISSPSLTASAKPVSASPADCQRKKEQLISYRSAAKITETNGLGETVEYSDEQRQKLIDTTERAIHDTCESN